jgi:hypothetical protein
MKVIRTSIICLALLLLGSSQARAEEPGLLTDWGMSVRVGGGFEDFNDDAMQDTTSACGVWDVRYQLGTRTPIAFEAAYVGSAQSIDAIGLDTDAILLGNGVEGAIRFNPLIGYPVQPYLFAGAGWRHYDLTNIDTNTSDVAGADDVLEIPVGGGIGYTLRHVVLDARFTYRAASEADLIPAGDGTYQSLDRWGASASVGYEF